MTEGGRYDAIIIGAGPAGAAAAILLAQAAWSVALVEKQGFPRRKVCGECVAASNIPLLHALGVSASFAALAGPPLQRFAFMRGDVQIVAELPAMSTEAQPWGRALGREALDTLLRDRAVEVGVHMLQPWLAQQIEGGPGDWRCHLRAANSLAARCLAAPILIDAHGSWEPLRTAGASSGRGPDKPHRASDLFGFKANFRGSRLPAGLLPVLSFKGGYGGMVIADGGVMTLACCIRRDRLAALRKEMPGLPAGEVVELALKHACAGVAAALQGATREGPWLASGPLDPGVHLDHTDGIFRIGNAAGEAHPIIGEGMSMALQSAWLLCAHLLHKDQVKHARVCDPTWQQTLSRRYASAWRRAFAPRIRLAAIFAHIAMRPFASAGLVHIARAWPGLFTLGARLGGKTRCAVDAPALRSLSIKLR